MRQPKDIVINGKTLEQILIDHQHWVNKDCDDLENMKANLCGANLFNADLYYANLRGADLRNVSFFNADLRGADLRGADLHNADLRGADLCNANLRGANLCYTDLYNADLYGANLYNANLYSASLYNANLCSANLCSANLRGADLRGANLRGANLYGAKGNLIDYRKGKILTEEMIGYKKCRNNVIVTLKIPRGAIVFSINGNKCRTNKAKVIDIDGADRAYSKHKYMSYYVGDEFNIYDFNCEYNVECDKGIHFFTTREEAENY